MLKPSLYGSDVLGTPVSTLAGSFVSFILFGLDWFCETGSYGILQPFADARFSCLRLLSTGTESLNLTWILKLDF